MKQIIIRIAALGTFLVLFQALAGAQSLADFARKQRQERARENQKPVKVFTNDNLPARPPSEPTAPVGTANSETPSKPGSVIPAVNLAQKAAQSASSETQGASGAEPEVAGSSTSSTSGEKTREYWQARFQQARAQLAHAQEVQRLVEDEMSLLELQKARELDPNKIEDLNNRIAAKQTDVEEKQAAAAKAQKALDELEQEFKESGAPVDWIKAQ